VHKSANILDALPKSIQPLAKKMLTEVRDAEDREHARDAAKAFDNEFHAKWPKTAEKLRDDLEPLLCFFDFPAEHWVHLKTSNPIESTFSTVRLRTKVTKSPGSRAAGLAMAFKLTEAAEEPLALRQRRRARRSRARWCEVPKGGVGRDSCEAGGGRRVISGSGRSTTVDYSSV
jgi:transposase-like protein